MILGIDGGGTKTTYILTDLDGKILAEYTHSTLHYYQIGFEGVKKNILEGLAYIMQSAHITEKHIDYITIGMPGFGESKKDERTLLNLLDSIMPCPYQAMNDVKLAWVASLEYNPGLCIIAGTGSMCYGVDEHNNDVRCGGWGSVFGDEGSAYWIGVKTCELFSKMSDGRIPKGPLYQIIKKNLSITDDFDIIDYTTNNTRTTIAAIAPLLDTAAKEHDTYALKIFEQAAYELLLLVKGSISLYAKKTNAPILLSYLGGVFQSGDYFLQLFKDALAPYPVVIRPPAMSSVHGACLYGAIILNIKNIDAYKKELRFDK